MSNAFSRGKFRGQLTVWQRHQVPAVVHVEVLEAGQLPEAFGQQTGEQLVRKLFLQ